MSHPLLQTDSVKGCNFIIVWNSWALCV